MALTDRWIECWDCQGDEGQVVEGEWVDCSCCQGEGGHPEVYPEGQGWSCSCKGEEGQ